MEMYWVIKASLELIFVMASMVVMSSGKSDIHQLRLLAQYLTSGFLLYPSLIFI